jgi:hypothetical protein
VQYIQVWGCNSFYFLLGHQFPELHCNWNRIYFPENKMCTVYLIYKHKLY